MQKYFLLNIVLWIGSAALAQETFSITHGPYIQNMGENEATIVWTTSADALSWVELAPDGNDSFYARERPKHYQAAHGSRTIGKLHKVTLTGLQPATRYRYRIFSKEVLKYKGHKISYGEIASSDVYRKKPYAFTTLSEKKQSVSLRVVNDIHAKNDNLQKLLGDVTKENTDLVIFNGDMVSILNEENDIFSGFMNTATELFASEIPLFYARGNHETRGKASALFFDYFPTNNGHCYYTFRQGPVAFLVLDSGEDKPDSDIEYAELADFDRYRTQQAEWIEKTVKTPQFQSAPFRIAVMHIPPAESTWHGAQDVAGKFMPLLNDANIDILLCGHTHNLKYIPAGEISRINFPLLINDDETCLRIAATDKEITIDIKDLAGKTLATHRIEKDKRNPE